MHQLTAPGVLPPQLLLTSYVLHTHLCLLAFALPTVLHAAEMAHPCCSPRVTHASSDCFSHCVHLCWVLIREEHCPPGPADSWCFLPMELLAWIVQATFHVWPSIPKGWVSDLSYSLGNCALATQLPNQWLHKLQPSKPNEYICWALKSLLYHISLHISASQESSHSRAK
jgi:hypothetical protein